MVFSSQIFLFVFLPLCILGAYLVRPDFRKYFLILASLAFFAWNGKVPLAIFVVFVFVNYGFGLLLGKTRNKTTRVKSLSIWFVILSNVAFLLAFRYLPFMIESFTGVTGLEMQKIVDEPELLNQLKANIRIRQLIPTVEQEMYTYRIIYYDILVDSG